MHERSIFVHLTTVKQTIPLIDSSAHIGNLLGAKNGVGEYGQISQDCLMSTLEGIQILRGYFKRIKILFESVIS
jgi:hypothetical protein